MNAAAGPSLVPSLTASNRNGNRSRTHAHIDSSGDWRCVGIPKHPPLSLVSSLACKRTVTWFVAGIGPQCHVCFESTLALDWRKIDIGDIHRLSDRESDFFKG